MTAQDPRGGLATAAALRSGELEATALAEETLAAARTVGAETGAFAHLLEELTRTQAREAAERLAAARRDGTLEDLARTHPLLGVPLPLKEIGRAHV